MRTEVAWRSRSIYFLLLINLLVSATCSGQKTAIATGQEETFLLQAARTYGFGYQEQPPWHMKITFRTFDSLGSLTDQGTFEEIWESPTQYLQRYSSTSISRSQYGTPQGPLYVGNPGLPDPVRLLRTLIENPLMDPITLARYTVKGNMGSIRRPRANLQLTDRLRSTVFITTGRLLLLMAVFLARTSLCSRAR